jgi:predicted secreted protein
MTSNAVTGIGAEFRRYNTGTSKWERIAELTSFDGPNKKRDTVDVTSLDSTDGYKEFIGGLRDAGEVKLPMHFTRDGYDLANDDFESDTKQNYEISLPDPDNTTFSFLGLITALELKVAGDKAISADFTVKISGPVTINSGSGPAPI